jgi:rod shape-determining protein MreD
VLLDWAKSAALVFVAAILQVSVFSTLTILNGTPDLLLVAIICVALLRGPVVGAVIGFWGGLLVDTANLGTLGVTSLLLTVAGYWIGRYGETTGRDRTHAPFVSVAVITLLYAVGSLAFRFVLGDPAPARAVLWSTLFQGIALNLILTWPVYALARFVLPPFGRRRDRVERIHAIG